MPTPLSEVRVVPVVEEELLVETTWVDTARVQVRKRVEERVKSVHPPLMREEIEVERREVGQFVDAAAAPHQDGDTLVIPVYEEVLVLEKKLLLKEEVRITRTYVPLETTPQDVVLRREQVEVERTPLE